MHCFPVFCHGSACNFSAFIFEHFSDFTIAEGFGWAFLPYQPFDSGPYGGRGLFIPVMPANLTGEKVAKFQHSSGRMHVFAGSYARNG